MRTSTICMRPSRRRRRWPSPCGRRSSRTGSTSSRPTAPPPSSRCRTSTCTSSRAGTTTARASTGSSCRVTAPRSSRSASAYDRRWRRRSEPGAYRARGRRQARPRRPRARRQDRGPCPARRRLRGHLHGPAPDPGADRGHRGPGGRGCDRAQRALRRPQLPLQARARALEGEGRRGRRGLRWRHHPARGHRRPQGDRREGALHARHLDPGHRPLRPRARSRRRLNDARPGKRPLAGAAHPRSRRRDPSRPPAARLPAGTEQLDRPTATRERPPAVVVDEDDRALIMYTSGTTGRPKGALGTHVGIVTSSISFERCMGLGDGERTLVAVPRFHVTGLIGQLLTMAWLGGTTVVMRTFDAAEAIRLLDAERITYMIAAPTVFTMMLRQPGARDAGRSLRRVGYGGAPTPPDGIVALREWLPQATLQNAYGMTETSSPTTLMPFGQELARISSVGWPVPIAELRTVDVGTGRECAADEVGELWVRGPHVVPGYWANPEATAATMGDGWERSGDLARIEADGYVTIMDRLKDMINRGGENIYCVEVEDVLCAHPAVLEAAG